MVDDAIQAIAIGPCLILGMVLVALLIVWRSFSPDRHVLLWAASTAASLIEWSLIGLFQFGSWRSPISGIVIQLFTLTGTLLLFEGFRLRAGRHGGGLLAMAGMAGVAEVGLIVVAWWLGSPPLVESSWAILSIPLLAWAIGLVRRSGDRLFPCEAMAAGALLGMILVDAVGLVFRLSYPERSAVTPPAMLLIYLTPLIPSLTAMAISLLLLIAHDFSAELRRIGHTDPLTEVLNRRGLAAAAARLLRRRGNRLLSVVVADLDLFKQVNDAHGHAAGDATLRRFAAHLAASAGRDEAVARIGGEEFALLLPGADGATAARRMEQLRQTCRQLSVDGLPDLAITASFGVAERQRGETWQQALERADAALYRSKDDGRDRTTLAPPGPMARA